MTTSYHHGDYCAHVTYPDVNVPPVFDHTYYVYQERHPQPSCHGMWRRRPHLIHWASSIQIWMDEPQFWRVRLLSEESSPWLDILAKSSLVSECVERACVRCRLHVFAINLEFFSPLLHSWILPWWSERQLDLLCVFEKRFRTIMSVLLSSFSLGKNASIFMFSSSFLRFDKKRGVKT